MANSEHIQWLLEGVGAWNERRKREHFKPDLRGAHIPGDFGEGGLDESAEPEIRRMVFRTEDAGVDLSGIDLSEAELQDAILTNVNLSNANLRGADLKGCDFDGAILNEADLDFADLRRCTFHSGRLQGAKMFGGNRVSGSHNSISLCHAEFFGADLRGAILANRELSGADLRYAKLEGTNLFRTQPWKAILFSGGNADEGTSTGVRSGETIESVRCVLQECSNIRYDFPDRVLYFRGEAKVFPELRPSLMRKKNGTFMHLKSEAEMMVDLMSRRPVEFDNLKSALAQWGYIRVFQRTFYSMYRERY